MPSDRVPGEQEFGHVDILVNNAAFQMTHESILEIPSEEIEVTFRTNILSQFYQCKACIPHMKPGASIINTTSVQAYQPSPELMAYAAIGCRRRPLLPDDDRRARRWS